MKTLIHLQESEVYGEAKCGCDVENLPIGTLVRQCDMHAAAEDMYKMLQRVAPELTWTLRSAVEKLLIKANPTDPKLTDNNREF